MKRVTLSFFMWILVYIYVIVCQTQKEYGLYKTELLSIEPCKGPKRGECGILNVARTLDKSTVRFIKDIQKECSVKNAKLIVKKANHTNALWHYQTSKPCQHFVLGPILKKSFNLTDNHCKIKKGHYEVNINVDELSKHFFGLSFFYDTFSFKLFAHNDVNNLYCIKSVLRISEH